MNKEKLTVSEDKLMENLCERLRGKQGVLGINFKKDRALLRTAADWIELLRKRNATTQRMLSDALLALYKIAREQKAAPIGKAQGKSESEIDGIAVATAMTVMEQIVPMRDELYAGYCAGVTWLQAEGEKFVSIDGEKLG